MGLDHVPRKPHLNTALGQADVVDSPLHHVRPGMDVEVVGASHQLPGPGGGRHRLNKCGWHQRSSSLLGASQNNPLVGSTPKRETGGGTRYRLLASRSPAKSRCEGGREAFRLVEEEGYAQKPG